MSVISKSTCLILAVATSFYVAPASLEEVPETLDAARLKVEAARLSTAGRQAFREALLACASYHEHNREEPLQLQCERHINIFEFDFAESDSRIILFLKSVMNMARADASPSDSASINGKAQKRTKRAQYFFDQLVRAYRETRPY
jgi:hypothetical protein